MITKAQAKRKQDIKTKLMAAIAMLLVSSIMMVSSTYAWFTLSTAPEVTGIETAVGANGNLEMALLPSSGDVNEIGTGIGVTGPDNINRTWGNLVDLSEDTFYGMDKISLYPSAINTTTISSGDKTVPALNDAGYLLTPDYGADGRVSVLKANTVTSTFVHNGFPSNGLYGVRAVGTASGMTDRQLAYRNSRANAGNAVSLAQVKAATSLNQNGAALATIAMALFTNNNPEFTEEQIAPLIGIANDLLGSENNKGVIDYIEEAYINYIIAFAASAANTAMDDLEFNVWYNDFTQNVKTLDDAITKLGGVSVPGLDTAKAKLDATKATVEEARTDLESLTGDNITWTQLNPPLSQLADTSKMEVNGYTISEVKANMSALVNELLGGKGLTVTIVSGGGVYADVADHCGNYSASVTVKNVSLSGFTVDEATATMKAETNLNPAYLVGMGASALAAGTPSSGTGDVAMPITDFYGYIIDLAFRTNASESNLLLQTPAVDRIYSDNSAEAETKGHGSTMTFTAGNGLTLDQLKTLMGAIRVVFFDTTSREIFGYAKLDMANIDTVGGNQITANLYLYETTVESYTTATAEQIAATGAELYTKSEGTEVYTKLTGDPVTDGSVTYYVKVAASENWLESDTERVIRPLPQNTAVKVSALVYLDGENVGNDDVSATGSSMTGTMNLQFASSANLVPMEYGQLHTPATVNEYDVTIDGVAQNEKAKDNADFTYTVPTDKTVSSVTVGGVTYDSNNGYTLENNVLTIPKDKVNGNIVITLG